MPRAMTRYVFEEVKYRASKRVLCGGCGKPVTRAKTFTRTVNPFNKREDGTPRTWSEVQEQNRQEATRWVAEPEDCTACLRTVLRA